VQIQVALDHVFGMFAQSPDAVGDLIGKDGGQGDSQGQGPGRHGAHGQDELANAPLNGLARKAQTHFPEIGSAHTHGRGKVVNAALPGFQQLDARFGVGSGPVGPQKFHRKPAVKSLSQDIAGLIENKGVNHFLAQGLSLVHHVLEPQQIAGEQRVHGAGSQTLGQGRASLLALVQQRGRGHAGHQRRQAQGGADHNGRNAQDQLGAKPQAGKDSHSCTSPGMAPASPRRRTKSRTAS
jgi:hypothetical protein